MKCPKVLYEPNLETKNIGQQHKNTRKIGDKKYVECGNPFSTYTNQNRNP